MYIYIYIYIYCNIIKREYLEHGNQTHLITTQQTVISAYLIASNVNIVLLCCH